MRTQVRIAYSSRDKTDLCPLSIPEFQRWILLVWWEQQWGQATTLKIKKPKQGFASHSLDLRAWTLDREEGFYLHQETNRQPNEIPQVQVFFDRQGHSEIQQTPSPSDFHRRHLECIPTRFISANLRVRRVRRVTSHQWRLYDYLTWAFESLQESKIPDL